MAPTPRQKYIIFSDNVKPEAFYILYFNILYGLDVCKGCPFKGQLSEKTPTVLAGAVETTNGAIGYCKVTRDNVTNRVTDERDMIACDILDSAHKPPPNSPH
jgi:hypothetical protein